MGDPRLRIPDRSSSHPKSYLAETWPTLDDEERQTVRGAAAVLVADVVSLSLNPDVFTHLGIDAGAEIALNNPHHRANVVDGLAKLTTFRTALEAIADRLRNHEERLRQVEGRTPTRRKAN